MSFDNITIKTNLTKNEDLSSYNFIVNNTLREKIPLVDEGGSTIKVGVMGGRTEAKDDILSSTICLLVALYDLRESDVKVLP